MQKNPCYGDHTIPVYDEIQLQDKAPEPTDVRVKQNERISSLFANKTETKCITVVVVLSLLTIAMVVAIALFASARVDSNQDLDSLMEEIQELKMQLNETKEASETNIAKLRMDLTRIETDGLMLQNSVDTANNATMTQLNSLQSSANALTTRVNSPVNLYQNCIQETESCTNTQSGSGYRKFCTTSSLPVNKSGYYTLSMACKYDPPPEKLDTSTLRQSGSNVHCLCETTSFVSSTGAHLFASFPTFTCTLVITRCPTSQNIV